MRRQRVADSTARAITRVVRADLIIVDDIGPLPVSLDAAEGFYRFVGRSVLWSTPLTWVVGKDAVGRHSAVLQLT